MSLGRLSYGERIAGVSAIVLFVSMFFHWFYVKAVNTSNLLFLIESVLPGKNAWEALEYISMVLLITIFAAFVVMALRLANVVSNRAAPVNAPVAILGLVSMLLILFRIVEPPVFDVQETVTFEGAVQFPIFIALLAALGITFGACLAMREEGISVVNLRLRSRGATLGQTTSAR